MKTFFRTAYAFSVLVLGGLGFGCVAADGGGVEDEGEALGSADQEIVSEIVNGNFELGPAPRAGSYLEIPAGSSLLPGWTVGGDGVDYKDTGYFAAASGRYSVDMAPSPGRGTLSTTLATVPGGKYQVSFMLAGNPLATKGIKTLTVSAAGAAESYTFDTTLTTRTNMGWVQRTFDFTATSSSTTLTFANATAVLSNHGPALDDIRITTLCEPPALVNGDFERGPNPALDRHVDILAGGSELVGWTVGGNGVEQDGNLVWSPASGQYSVDLAPLGPGAGVLSQSFATIPGARYKVSFSLAGNFWGNQNGRTLKTVEVSAGAVVQSYVFDTTGKSATNMGWEQKTLDFTAASSVTTLTFRNTTAPIDSCGPTLDAVAVTCAP